MFFPYPSLSIYLNLGFLVLGGSVCARPLFTLLYSCFSEVQILLVKGYHLIRFYYHTFPLTFLIFSNANIISVILTGCILQFKNSLFYFIYQKKKKGSVLIFSLLYFPASREKCYKQIQAAIAKFREIKENINEGLKFYVTLQVRNVWLDCAVQVFI